RYLDPAWRTEIWRQDIWDGIMHIPDNELWRAHERRRERLVAFARSRLRRQLINRGAAQHEIEDVEEISFPCTLMIGFARRFASYKRVTRLFRDLDRLKRILTNLERPVQIIFAGKAHPHDTGGKELIRHIANVARDPELRHHIVFLEDYDMNIARYLVQGVDVWLNTPRRPKEASGTSGMKVIYNGGLNCSILDGWWAEGYSPAVGWAIGNGEEYPEYEWDHQDYVESEALYNILEQSVIPLFYDRGRDTVPREWIAKIKNAYRELAPFFNTHRMVEEYTDQLYMPAFSRASQLLGDKLETGLSYAAWRKKIEAAWSNIEITDVNVSEKTVKVSNEVEVNATVKLASLTPDDVRVQLYYGPLTPRGEIGTVGEAIDMQPNDSKGNGVYHFSAKVSYPTSGERGISVRVVPYHECLPTPF